MEDLLMELARTAYNERAVARRVLENGMELLVYPHSDAVLVGFGLDRDMAEELQHEELLRKRSENLERFGAWQPALLTDGSYYLVRRVPDADPYGLTPIVTSEELADAEELLT